MKNAESNTVYLILYQLKFLLLFLPWPLFSFAGDSIPTSKHARFQLKGYIKDMQSVFFIDNARSMVTGNFLHNRINFRWNVTNQIHLRIESRNRLFYGEQVKTSNQFGKFIDTDQGLIDLSYNVVDDTSIVINTLLDRVLLNWTAKKWDVTIGRQRINWGVNLVWNPNDIFNAFNYFDFDYEERPGTDAIRIQYNVGEVSALELACKLSDNKKEQVGAFIHRTNFRKYDLQNFAGIYFEDLVLGSGWAGSINKTGFLGEVSYFHPYKNIADTNGTLIASVSFDRTFKGDYFLMASYLYSSNGKESLYGSADFLRSGLSAKNLMPFEHTFFVQITKSLNPLVSAGFSCMFSPAKNTLILFPSLTVSLSNDWDLALMGQAFFADVNNVYRTIGNTVYLRLRWSY